MRPLVVAGLLLCVAFAGCTEPEPEPEEATSDNIVTDPKDYSYLDEPSQDGGGWHVHDYWRQQDTLEILSEDRAPCQCSASSTDGNFTMSRFRPEPESVIPQGAKWINITPDWTIASGDYQEVHLYIKTANMAQAEFFAAVEPGQTVTFESSNDDNDPPHHILSLWEFHLVIDNGDDTATASEWGTSIHVTASRGLEIPSYPPHPDFWKGATELQLVSETKTIQQFGYGVPTAGSSTNCFGGCLGRFDVDDGAVVPFDAERLQVRYDFEPGSVPTLGLEFHGAGTWDFAAIEPETSAVDHLIWVIDVQEHFGDSPYAKQTLWEFRMTWDESTPARAYRGAVTYTVTVHNDH